MRSVSRLVYAGLLGALTLSALAQPCDDPDALSVRAKVYADQVVRADMPRELFGFNVPWRDFQLGYFDDGAVRTELIDLLKPFEGAVYRYPGGTPSNWFDWGEATRGPQSKRVALHADFERYAKAEFGPAEFAGFVRAVGGRAILTLNLMGPYKKPLPPAQLKAQSLLFAELVKSTPGFGCGGGKGCTVMALELGNELDWHPFMLSAGDYVARADAVRAVVSKTLPEAVWIAQGRTAPWDKRDTADFDKAVARGLGERVQGIAVHPYYDGIDVPAAAGYVRAFAEHWQSARPDARVYVTEHARWPAEAPPGRKWEDNWYEATGLGGAISTADFMLALMPMQAVAAANWHALGTQGPWQLVRRDRRTGRLFASPVYWGLRVLREAYLDQLVKIDYTPTRTARYSGGYDQRLVAMRKAQGGQVSVLGVNRASRPFTLELEWAAARGAGSAQMRFISADSAGTDNDEARPDAVHMATQSADLPARRARSTWCVPPRSVFSMTEP